MQQNCFCRQGRPVGSFFVRIFVSAGRAAKEMYGGTGSGVDGRENILCLAGQGHPKEVCRQGRRMPRTALPVECRLSGHMDMRLFECRFRERLVDDFHQKKLRIFCLVAQHDILRRNSPGQLFGECV